jgi:hypothetical protein
MEKRQGFEVEWWNTKILVSQCPHFDTKPFLLRARFNFTIPLLDPAPLLRFGFKFPSSLLLTGSWTIRLFSLQIQANARGYDTQNGNSTSEAVMKQPGTRAVAPA